jgi:hypothetical protein
MNKISPALRERYKDKHPLLFQRSVEFANTNGELFDIIESVPELPVVWDAKSRRWATTDLVQRKTESL